MDLNIFTALFHQVLQTPSALLLILVVSVIAYALESIPKFNSKYILHVCLVVGPFLSWRMMSPGSVDPSFPNPLTVILSFGLIEGLIAFIVHKAVIAKLIAKFSPEEPTKTPNSITQSEPPKP